MRACRLISIILWKVCKIILLETGNHTRSSHGVYPKEGMRFCQEFWEYPIQWLISEIWCCEPWGFNWPCRVDISELQVSECFVYYSDLNLLLLPWHVHSKTPHVVTVLCLHGDDVVTILSPTSGTSERLQNRVSVPPGIPNDDYV